MGKYKVTCKKCGGYDEIQIDESSKRIFFTKHLPIIAGRFRPDLKWGWECTCGNDSRLAPQEKDKAEILVAGVDKLTIKEMVKNLEKKPQSRFKMESI